MSIFLLVQHVLETSFSFIRYNSPFLWGFVDFFLLALSSVVRLNLGNRVAEGIESCPRPEQPLVIYEYEGCPFCKKVREVLSYLDIDHIVKPCPRETLKSHNYCLNSRYRPEVKELGGTCIFPFLVDPNKDVKMYQSEDIINYLWTTYGTEAKKSLWYRIARNPFYMNWSLRVASACRCCFDMGVFRAASRKPEKPLELWGMEASPFCRRVQESLATLELPYVYHTVAKGSTEKRKVFLKNYGDKISVIRKRLGLIKVPFLKDPNTNTELFESSKIVEYLQRVYQTAPVPDEKWTDMKH